MTKPTMPSLEQRLMVTGVEGPVGANVALALADRFSVVGLAESPLAALEGCRIERWRPNDVEELQCLVRRERPHWIVHCGPLAQGSWDLPDAPPSAAQETRTCRTLAHLAAELGGRLTVLTSDAACGGPTLFHDEEERSTAEHPFARACRRVEKALASTEAMLVRTHAYGWSPPGVAEGFAQRVWESIVTGSPCRASAARHASPILATHLAEYLLAAYLKRIKGPYHIAGAERTSAYRFAREMALACGLRGAAAAVREPDAAAATHPPAETALNTQRARRDLGRSMPLLREGLETFAAQARGGHRARLHSLSPKAA